MNNCSTKFEKLFKVLAWVAAGALIFYAGWYTEGVEQEQRAYRILRESCIGVPEPEQCALCGEGIPYAIVDLHDLPYLQVYPIRKGKRVTIGDYQVTMTAGEDKTLEVCVTGMVEF